MDELMTYKQIKKVTAWILIAIFVLLIYAYFTRADVVTNTTYLDPGDNTSVFWDCSLFGGDDYNGTFVCNGECSQINYTNSSYIELFLQPGSTKTGTEGNCEYFANCSKCESNTTNICQVDERLKPGEEYTLNDGVCELEFECREYDEPDCDDIIEEIKTRITYTVHKENDTIKIEIGDRFMREFDLDDDTEFMTQGNIEATCPFKNNTCDPDNMSFDQCMVYKDYFISPTWYMEGFKHWTNALNSTNNDIVHWQSKYESMNLKYMDCENAIKSLNTRLTEKDNELSKLQQEINGGEGWIVRYDDLNRQRATWKFVGITLAITQALTIIAILFLLIMKSTRRRRNG